MRGKPIGGWQSKYPIEHGLSAEYRLLVSRGWKRYRNYKKTLSYWITSHLGTGYAPTKGKYLNQWPKTTAERKLLKSEVYAKLGNKCVRCGTSDSRVLEMNHKNGDGYVDRRRVSYIRRWREILSGERDDIELLCCNCNRIHAIENGLGRFGRW